MGKIKIVCEREMVGGVKKKVPAGGGGLLFG